MRRKAHRACFRAIDLPCLMKLQLEQTSQQEVEFLNSAKVGPVNQVGLTVEQEHQGIAPYYSSKRQYHYTPIDAS
jgi:hypothetical protein